MIDLQAQKTLISTASDGDRKMYNLIQIDRNNVPSSIEEIRFCNECEFPFLTACRKQKCFRFGIFSCVFITMMIIAAIGRSSSNYNYYYDYYTDDYYYDYYYNSSYYDGKEVDYAYWSYNSDYDMYCDTLDDKANLYYSYDNSTNIKT